MIIDRKWCADRVVDEWKKLSTQVMNANTMESFKRLYRIMDEDERWY